MVNGSTSLRIPIFELALAHLSKLPNTRQQAWLSRISDLPSSGQERDQPTLVSLRREFSAELAVMLPHDLRNGLSELLAGRHIDSSSIFQTGATSSYQSSASWLVFLAAMNQIPLAELTDPTIGEVAVPCGKNDTPYVTQHHMNGPKDLFTAGETIAEAIWHAPSCGEGQAIFEHYFYHSQSMEFIGDLGAGDGELSIELARRHPTSRVVAIDAKSSALQRFQLPKNVFPLGGATFENVLKILRNRKKDGPSSELSLDGIYIFLPNPDQVKDYLKPALKMAKPGTLLQLVTERPDTADEAYRFLSAKGFTVTRLPIPHYTAPQTDSLRKYYYRMTQGDTNPMILTLDWIVATLPIS